MADLIPGGTISITRPEPAETPVIRIVIKIGGQRVWAELSAEDFALALTGRSEVPVAVEIRKQGRP